MNACNILSLGVGGLDLGHDFIKVHGRCIDHMCTVGGRSHDFFGHQRSGIEADRAFFDQAQAAHSDQIRGARTGANEMNSHYSAPPFLEVSFLEVSVLL